MPRALVIGGQESQAAVRALQGAGYEVTAATDPAQGSRLTATQKFDVVVTPGGAYERIQQDLVELRAGRELSDVALHDAEALHRSFAEGLPVNLLCKNLKGQFTFANGLFCKELRKTLSEIIGKTDDDFFGKELGEKYRADDAKVMKSRQVFTTVEEHRLPSGEKRYVEVLKAPVYNAAGDVTGVQIVFWDVTDRKQAQDNMEESESRHRAILKAALDCIITIDQEGRIIEFNPAAEKTFGYRQEEALGKDLSETLFPAPSRDRPRDNMERYEDAGEMGSMLGRRFEQPMIRKGGERFLAEMCMQPVPLEGSTVFTLFLRDITDRKRAEEEIQRKNRDLETLLYVTSHDLREPLRAIHNFSKLVCERYAGQIDERGQDFLRRVLRGTERLDRLLEDVLTLSRAQRSVEPTDDVALADVVNDVLQQLEARIERTQAKIQPAADLPRICADRRWVTQAIYNLVANALKFTKDGESPDIEIVNYLPEAGDLPGVGVIVRDRGPGVPLGYHERIFQLFQRAVGREVEGTGAGLAIVRQIAERHGGHAWCRNREEGGSEFLITFGAGRGG